MHACPALRPRWDLRARPLRRVDVAFRQLDDVGSHDSLISGLNHTAYMLAVYASQPGLPHVHARLASGWWPASTERECLPAGLQREVSSCCYTSSSSPRLTWRTQFLTR